ncbi:hypothetical protein ACFY3U_16795 [Micromonospora sp. NPDC000089]|uniref:hypothetical protein n=1 Tax=unclassified Micromonospora TaxID=2617518 RepID=UPI003678E1F9
MTVVTGRRAGRDEPTPGAAPGSTGDPDAARAGAVAPRRRRPEAGEAPVEVEPTTGAPVDAVPRRVPLRRPRGARADRPTDEGTSGDPFFWAPIEEVHWDGTPLREEARRRQREPEAPARRRPRPVRPPDPRRGLAVLLALGLVAAFFAWVSAAPLWLAVGHGTTGTVTLTDCTGSGLAQRCRGIFAAERDRFLVHGVRVSGVPADRNTAGTALPARMTGDGATTAYVDTGVGRHLRWLLGLVAVLGCGAGITRWTGATRLADPVHRRWAVAGGYAGPLLLTLGFLAAAW